MLRIEHFWLETDGKGDENRKKKERVTRKMSSVKEPTEDA